jgi:hypothetical protein
MRKRSHRRGESHSKDWFHIISRFQEGPLKFEVQRSVYDSRTASELAAVTFGIDELVD